MRLWRIASGRHDPLDGEGAQRFGGRWNSPRRPAVYTSAHASLAVLEKLVWTDPEDLPDDLRLFEVDLPDDFPPAPLDPARLPSRWTEAGSPACARIGDEWLASGESVALAVPSALLPRELRWTADRVAGLRVFVDEQRKVNRSVADVGGADMDRPRNLAKSVMSE